jgi:methyltransferase (TIGR00027 family)
MGTQRASRTAVFVCQARAVAHGRLGVGRFDDPTALALLRDGERTRVERARSGVEPKAWSQRLDVELLTRQAESMTARTVAIDDAVRAGAHPQVVILGAGLDGRAWRMPELSGVAVFEVDHPASQQDKRERATALDPAAGPPRFVPVDLTRAALGPALAGAGHHESLPTTWVLAGVIPYLTESDVAATVAAVAARSAPGNRLVVSYATGSPRAALGRLLARGFLRVTGRENPMAHEPRRSSWSPESLRAVLASAGLQVLSDAGLVALADELAVPTRQLGASRVAVAVMPAT